MRTILLGEAPAREMDGLDVPAFSSRSGRFLSDLIGMDVRDAFATRNLLDRWPGASGGKGSDFPLWEAKLAATRFLQDIALDQRVIVAGKRAAKVLRLERLGYFEWGLVAGIPGRWAVIPHPSGVNRFWNEASNRSQARNFLREEILRTRPDAMCHTLPNGECVAEDCVLHG